MTCLSVLSTSPSHDISEGAPVKFVEVWPSVGCSVCARLRGSVFPLCVPVPSTPSMCTRLVVVSSPSDPKTSSGRKDSTALFTDSQVLNHRLPSVCAWDDQTIVKENAREFNVFQFHAMSPMTAFSGLPEPPPERLLPCADGRMCVGKRRTLNKCSFWLRGAGQFGLLNDGPQTS